MTKPADDTNAPSSWRSVVNTAEWLAAIVESSDDAIIGKTLDSVIRSWNRGAEMLFGYAAAEAIGQSVLILFPPELRHEEAVIVSRLARGERVDHYETVRVRKDGSLVEVTLSVSPIRDADGTVIGAAKIARDLTEANRLLRAERILTAQLQEQAIELENQIEESQSLQEELEQTSEEAIKAAEAAYIAQQTADDANRAKDQFLATMSHELRTPLNAIGGYVDLLDLGIRGPVTAEQRTDLERIKINQHMLLRLIDDILDFAKLGSGRFHFHNAPLRIDTVLHRLEAFIAPMLGQKAVTYSLEPCGTDAVAIADGDKVEQIMLNLLSNALKFTSEGRIVVRCVVHHESLAIEITDTGRGISADLLERIFEPFVQGDQNLTRTATGTGLGLSISRELARGMGGEITVRSQPDEGSTFSLILPRAESADR